MSVRRTPARSVLAGLLVLALIALGAATASFLRKVESFQTLGFEAEATAGQWLITSVDDAASGLESPALVPGDNILLVNGEPAASIAELGVALRARETSELLLLRDEEMLTVSYHRPRLRVDLPYLTLSLIGLGYLLIGFYTLWKDRRSPSSLFYVWCVTSAVFYLVTPTPPFDRLGQTLYALDHLARLLLAPLTLHLFTVFPTPLGGSTRARRLVPFLYLPAAVLLAIQVDLMAGGRWLGSLDPVRAIHALDQLELVHLVGFALASLGVLIWRLAASAEWEQRRQLVWIALGLAGGYLPFLALYVVPRALAIDPRPLMVLAAVVPLGLVPLTFAYAILRYKLWDIGIIVRDTISLSLTLLIGVFGFSLLNLLIGQVTTQASSLTRNMLTFTAGLVIAGLLVPARRGIHSSLTRLQYGRHYQRRRALADFGRELLTDNDLGRVSRSLLERLEETVEIDRVNLLLTQESSLVPVRPESGLPAAPAADALDERLWKNDVSSLSGVALPADEPPLEQLLFALDYRYLLPLKVRDKRVGVLVTSYRIDGSPLSSDDLDLIRNLLQQTALALENAKLLAQVRDQLDEVSRLQRFSQGIIESSPAGIAVIDPGGTVLSANASFARLVGRSLDELGGADIREVMRGQALPSPEEGILESHFTTPDGEERYLQLSSADVRRPDRVDQRLLILQDVSERVAMENALKEKDRLASLGMLAAGVAHEVNTPITGISSYAQMLLADTAQDDPRYPILKKVELQTFRASRIVNNLLDFSRNRKSDFSPFELGPVVHEALELLEERRLGANVRLGHVELPEGVLVRGDSGEIQQVVTNLLVNAIEAMDPSGGTLSCSITGDDKWVSTTVADTGPGIPSDQLERIFQPFFSTRLGKGGTGLGLSISYNIVRRHGGEIRVVSLPNEGTQFIVELPRHLAKPAGTA
jgi:PAS domain S-box-containing protein